MAGTVTHSYFAMDVYNKLDKKLKNKLINHTNNLRVFGQGHDIFTFSTLRKSRLFHTTNTQLFFLTMVDYIKQNKLYNNPEILSYVYGYMCHYVLDKNFHPFVKYKCGKYVKGYKNTYKYRCLHEDMETFVDTYMIRKKDNIEPNKFKSHLFCLKVNKFSKDLCNLIDYTFEKTYGYKKVSKKYYHGIKNMYLLYILLRNDRFKIKGTIYRAVDKITGKYAYKFKPISFAYDKEDKKNYLNLNHEEWNHPMDKNEIYTSSFDDIYNNSVDEATKKIELIDGYFNNKKLELKKVFDNSSFATGKNCDDKRIEMYFEI